MLKTGTKLEYENYVKERLKNKPKELIELELFLYDIQLKYSLHNPLVLQLLELLSQLTKSWINSNENYIRRLNQDIFKRFNRGDFIYLFNKCYFRSRYMNAIQRSQANKHTIYSLYFKNIGIYSIPTILFIDSNIENNRKSKKYKIIIFENIFSEDKIKINLKHKGGCALEIKINNYNRKCEVKGIEKMIYSFQVEEKLKKTIRSYIETYIRQKQGV